MDLKYSQQFDVRINLAGVEFTSATWTVEPPELGAVTPAEDDDTGTHGTFVAAETGSGRLTFRGETSDGLKIISQLDLNVLADNAVTITVGPILAQPEPEAPPVGGEGARGDKPPARGEIKPQPGDGIKPPDKPPLKPEVASK